MNGNVRRWKLHGAILVRKKWRLVVLHHVHDDSAAIIPSVQYVQYEASLGPEPTQGGDALLALDQSDIATQLWLPRKGRPALKLPPHRTCERQNRETT
jgi:hypothetical protein